MRSKTLAQEPEIELEIAAIDAGADEFVARSSGLQCRGIAGDLFDGFESTGEKASPGR